MNKEVQFCIAVKNNNWQEFQKLNDPVFACELKIHCLSKIKYLILNMLNTHLHHEYVGSQQPFYISNEINRACSEDGLNILDYCAIAGLHELAYLFARLGAKPNTNIDEFIKNIQANPEDGFCSDVFDDIRLTIHNIKFGMEENDRNPLPKPSYYNPNDVFYKRIFYILSKFPYSQHKFSLLFLLLGIACVIAAPFSGGLTAILLCTLGIPCLLGAVSSLQSSYTALKSYEQVEENSRVGHEAYYLRTLRHEVSEMIEKQIRIQKELLLQKTKVHDTSVHVHISNIKVTPSSSQLLFQHNKTTSTKRRNIKFLPKRKIDKNDVNPTR